MAGWVSTLRSAVYTFSLAWAVCGCAAAPAWLADRGRDAIEVVSASVGLGVGVHSEVHVTEWVRADASLVWLGARVGVTDGNTYRTRHEVAFGIPLVLAKRFCAVSARSVRPLVPGAGQSEYDGSRFFPPSSGYDQFFLYSHHASGNLGSRVPIQQGLHVGFTVAVGFLSVGGGVDLFQLGDFVLGFFGIDVLADDEFQIDAGRVSDDP